MSKKFYESPIGTGRHIWVNKPDTKFNEDGVFKVDLVLTSDDPKAVAFSEKITNAAEEALAAYVADKKMTPGEAKKWSVYVPVSYDEDDDGNLTGYFEVNFRQNAKIKLKDGTVKDVSIRIVDAAGNDSKAIVRAGSEVRVRYSMRPVVLAKDKKVGVRLDFYAVQIAKLAKGSGGAAFGKIEGGYVEGDDYDSGEEADTKPEAPTDSDY